MNYGFSLEVGNSVQKLVMKYEISFPINKHEEKIKGGLLKT